MYISEGSGRRSRRSPAIRNTCTQSGELVTISGVRLYFRNHFLKSLKFRIIFLFIAVGIIPCLVLKAVILESYENRAVDVRTAQLQNQCTILCNQIGAGGYLDTGLSEVLEAELEQMSGIYNGRIMLINSQYQITEDTYDLDTGKIIVSEDVMQCFEGEGTKIYDRDNQYIEVTSPVFVPGSEQVSGVLLASVSADSVLDGLSVLGGTAWVAVGVTALLVAALAVILGSVMVRPFARITSSIEAVSEGYDTNYLHENAYTETSLLSEAFNKMLGRLKILDDSRQEFVANVSHELKTPITSMKVLADSLLVQEDAPVELYREFMADLSEEIEREDKIINDLLSLVKMDKTASTLDVKQTNINELVEKILKRLQPIAAAANIEVVFESFRPVNAEIDEVKLSLAITNLVENAVKYNVEGGWVHVSLNADHKFFYIEVADSGIGIPAEAQEHIFERFYRVDKSHSREIGGTGLGLAIARNAVVLHRGAVKVYSQVGEGTTFTVRIPLSYVV
ncbi:HAMP domain-containing protein [Faecalicatena fissicatena]|uniref:histidine kinase n=1 Tax=Faecalicatena fissicatena TaxID=290055 RepID=A0ABS2E6M9_9FIRM|nr:MULTISPECIES: ATP-binding protein [Eubacteriales]MBM6737288.1 HAMP domain-containing protein [Faecalicatena fissicatena]HIX98748.1 HAMP domain-containing protein [Candidatus Dorea intestinigallinarum]